MTHMRVHRLVNAKCLLHRLELLNGSIATCECCKVCEIVLDRLALGEKLSLQCCPQWLWQVAIARHVDLLQRLRLATSKLEAVLPPASGQSLDEG